MALIRDFELRGMGYTIPDAYFVVTKVEIEKRPQDLADPVDLGREDGLTNGGEQREDNEVEWKAGYNGKIAISVWASKANREAGNDPIGNIGTSPTDAPMDSNFGQIWKGFEPIFRLNVADDAPTPLTQAYTYLLTTPYFADAVQD